MKTRTLLFAGLCSLLLWTVTTTAAPGQNVHALKVGKKGEITLTQETKVGDIVLQPDTYVVQHRVSGGEHFVRFVELKQVEARQTPRRGGNYTYTEQDKIGELKCRVEPAPGPIKETTAYMVTQGGVRRITKVAIKGEGVVHVL